MDKEFEELLKKYEVAMQHGDSVYLEPDELTDIAEYYHQHGRTEEALEACDYALNIFPGATAPIIFKARAAMVIDNDTKKARELLAQANDKTDLEYYYMEAELLLYEGQEEEASSYVENVFRSLNDEEDEADFIIDVANLFADYSHYDLAQHWLTRTEERDSSDYRELQARIALSKGNFDEAENILNQLIDEDPYDGQYWNHLASAQLMRNHIAEAIDSTEFSIAINPDDQEAIYTKAHALFALNKYEEAQVWFGRYCRLCPSDQNGWLYQGMTLLNLEQFDKALHCFRTAEKLSHTNEETLLQLYQEEAFTLARQKQIDEAEEYVELAKALVKTDGQRHELLVLHGHILLENGHLLKAQRMFLQAIFESHQSPHVYLRIAISVYDCGYTRLAYRLLLLLFDNVGDKWADGYAYMALCCHDLGRQDEYIKYLKKACLLNQNEAQLVLSELFPAGLPVEKYVEYARQSL
ncbi:MAG: tetratricopeptide repeat protein [Prevotella sp.]|nr:tetratricopeptide repeat protein [Prevotella sp.]